TYGATFIIGPVLAVIAGVAIKKTKKEVSYYFTSRKAIRGVKAPTTGAAAGTTDAQDHYDADDESLILPVVMKLLKKFTRVKRRVAQLNPKGSVLGVVKQVGTVTRHPVTAVRGAVRNHQATKLPPGPFAAGSKAETDQELKRRLLELSYYG